MVSHLAFCTSVQCISENVVVDAHAISKIIKTHAPTIRRVGESVNIAYKSQVSW